jgi:hypothetical protein
MYYTDYKLIAYLLSERFVEKCSNRRVHRTMTPWEWKRQRPGELNSPPQTAGS